MRSRARARTGHRRRSPPSRRAQDAGRDRGHREQARRPLPGAQARTRRTGRARSSATSRAAVAAIAAVAARGALRLRSGSRGVIPMDGAAAHHEHHLLRGLDVGERRRRPPRSRRPPCPPRACRSACPGRAGSPPPTERAQGGRGRHPVRDQERELLGVAAVRADRGVGAEGDLHAHGQGPAEHGGARRRPRPAPWPRSPADSGARRPCPPRTRRP